MNNVKLIKNDIDDILNKLDKSIKGEMERFNHVMLLLDSHDDLVNAYIYAEVITEEEVDDDIEILFKELDEYVNAG